MEYLSKLRVFYLLFLIALIFTPIFPTGNGISFAAIPGLPYVPGGPDPATLEGIPGLISYVYNLAFWIVGLAVFINIFWGGFIVFFGSAGNASKLSEGKKKITNAIYGLIILLSAWMILHTINPDLVKNTFNFDAASTGIGVDTGAPNSSDKGVPPDDSTDPLCRGEQPAAGCSNANCSQYVASIDKYARGVANSNFLKAIMYKESKCGQLLSSPSGAYGIMQFRIATAKSVAHKCGVSPALVSRSWLLNPINFDAQICMSSSYFNDVLAPGICGNLGGDVRRHVMAGYNGGPKACKNSDGSCANKTLYSI